MAMDSSAMANSVIASLEAAGLSQQPDHKWWQAVCQGIIDHMKTNLEVLPVAHDGNSLTNPIGQAIGVTTGPGTGSTGATSEPQVITGTGSVK